MNYWATTLIFCLGAGLCLATPAFGGDQEPFAVGSSQGDGSWKVDGEPQRSAQNWRLDVHRTSDGRLIGRIDLGGSPLASSANVVGKVTGSKLSGAIIDDAGDQVATFTGILSESGIRGRYIDRTGEAGDWFWEGQLREQ